MKEDLNYLKLGELSQERLNSVIKYHKRMEAIMNLSKQHGLLEPIKQEE